MEMEGNLPTEIFYSLPEWCVFIETLGLRYLQHSIIGFFANLEFDIKDSSSKLWIVVMNDNSTELHIPIYLGSWGLEQGITEFFIQIEKSKGFDGNQSEWEKESIRSITKSITPFVNLILYLCSINADVGLERPLHPARKAKNRGKIQTAAEPRIWDVGERIGSALRKSRINGQTVTSGQTHATPRPHFRRAHWHHYWRGPLSKPEERTLILKWLPPIPVGMKNIEGPVVVRPVKNTE